MRGSSRELLRTWPMADLRSSGYARRRFVPRSPRSRKGGSAMGFGCCVRKYISLARVESIETRLLFAALPNALVNDPSLDATTADTQSETSTLVFGSTVMVVYNDSGSNAGSSSQFVGWSRSTNGGVSFVDRGRLPLDSDASDGITGDGGDPVLARDNISGRIYVSALAISGPGVQVFHSDDNGATLSAPVNGTPGFVPSSGDLIDKDWMTVDNFPGAGQGTVYVVARDFPGVNPGAKPAGIYLARSINNGTSFGTPQLIVASGGVGADFNQGAFVAVGPDHSVYLFWFDQISGSNVIRMRRSTDGGVNFAAAVTVATMTGTAANGDLNIDFRTNGFPQVAVNPVTGALYCVYNDNP